MGELSAVARAAIIMDPQVPRDHLRQIPIKGREQRQTVPFFDMDFSLAETVQDLGENLLSLELSLVSPFPGT